MPQPTPDSVAATRSVQIRRITPQVFHGAAGCQQLADFKAELSSDSVERRFFFSPSQTVFPSHPISPVDIKLLCFILQRQK